MSKTVTASASAYVLLGLLYGCAHSTLSQAEPSRLALGDSVIEVSIAPGQLALSEQDIQAWVMSRAKAIQDYYQGFPVRRLNLVVQPKAGNEVSGTIYRGEQPLLMLRVGATVTNADLTTDWVLTHELAHLAFPPVKRRHHWIEEGLATYIEPLARVKAGLLDPDQAWHWLLTGLPNGLPKADDKGLDHTPTWGRTYWGGALFCLLADIDIRQRTDNRFALQDALRAIVVAGGTLQQEDTWPLPKALAIGDRATGTEALMALYETMKASPAEVDLEALWQRLGVSLDGNTVRYQDDAPQAWLRRALISSDH